MVNNSILWETTRLAEVAVNRGIIDTTQMAAVYEDGIGALIADGISIIGVDPVAGWDEYTHLITADLNGRALHFLAVMPDTGYADKLHKALREIGNSIAAVQGEKKRVIRLIIAVDAILAKYGIDPDKL